MTSIHPHWHTTDEDEQPVSITVAESKQVAEENIIPRAKRTPAAFIGVVLFLVIGFVLFKGNADFSGQLTEADMDIMITPTAVDPQTVTITAGQTVKWINKSGIPQILESSTIFMPNGEPFKTTAIFPDAEFTFTIPEGVPAGTYDYESTTSAMITGEIVVEAAMPAALPAENQQSSASETMPVSSVAPVQMPVSVSSAASIASSRASVAQITPVGGIPVNPHTIGSTYVPVEQNLHQGAPRSSASISKHTPISQPTTGMGAWTVSIMGVLALIGVLIRARKIA
jgi:plastocyanin